MTIVLLGGIVVEEKGINIGNKTFIIPGNSSTNVTRTRILIKKKEREGLFEISSGSVVVKDVMMEEYSSMEMNRETAIIELSGNGRVSLENMIICDGVEGSNVNCFKRSIIIVSGGGSVWIEGVEWRGMFILSSVISFPSSLPYSYPSSLLMSYSNFTFMKRVEDIEGEIEGENSLSEEKEEEGGGEGEGMGEGYGEGDGGGEGIIEEEIKKRKGGSIVDTEEGVVSLSVYLCNFSSCVSEGSEEGGVIRHKGTSYSSVRVESCLFKSCKCSERSGRGGGMFIVIGDLYENPLFCNISFLINSAFVGRDMYIYCYDLKLIVNSSSFSFYFLNEMKVNSIVGRDKKYFVEEIDLIHLLNRFCSSEVYVSDSGMDDEICGMKEYQCKSINVSYEHLNNDSYRKIIISSIIRIYEVLRIEKVHFTSFSSNEENYLKFDYSGIERGENRILTHGNVYITLD
jgi:hypothetical protein